LLTSSKLKTKINNRHYARNELMFDIPNNKQLTVEIFAA